MPFPSEQHQPDLRGLRPRAPYAVPHTAAGAATDRGTAEGTAHAMGLPPAGSPYGLRPAGPYVPAPLRSRPRRVDAVARPTPLPWIEQFLDERNEHGDRGDRGDRGERGAESGADFRVEHVADGGGESEIGGDGDNEGGVEDAWPMDDARTELTSLSRAINHAIGGSDVDRRTVDAGHDDVGASLDLGALESALAAPLPMWNDSDMMDIMPVRAPLHDTNESSEDSPWASHARNETPDTDYSESVASLLESIARRVRDGKVVVSGFVPEMSDAAGLAATLASLLRTHE